MHRTNLISSQYEGEDIEKSPASHYTARCSTSGAAGTQKVLGDIDFEKKATAIWGMDDVFCHMIITTTC